MKIDELKLLYDYNDWIDARFLAACAKVSPEYYAAPESNSSSAFNMPLRSCAEVPVGR